MFHLRPGHLNLNLSLEDKWMTSPSFPCSKELACAQADEQQLLFSEEGRVIPEKPESDLQTETRGCWVLYCVVLAII